MPDNIFAEKRRQEIVKYVQEEGTVTVGTLCSRFSVSPATIRSDLTELSKLGLLHRTHGGAMRNNASFELTSPEKEVQYVEEKNAIAHSCLNLVRPHDVIALDSGTTTYFLAKMLADIKGITVVTYDLKTASLLETFDNINTFFLGGMVRKGFHCTIGNSVRQMLDQLHIDTLFLGTNGITLQRGLSTPNEEIAAIKRKMIEVSDTVVLMANRSKFGKSSFSYFASLDDIDIIVTDTELDDAYRAAASEHDFRWIQARPNSVKKEAEVL